MRCPICGAEMNFKLCDTCEGEGGYADTTGYFIICSACEGEEGWWVCPNRDQHNASPDHSSNDADASSRPDAPTLPEGTQGTVTLDELFFILSDGALGTRPRAYDETYRPRHDDQEK